MSFRIAKKLCAILLCASVLLGIASCSAPAKPHDDVPLPDPVPETVELPSAAAWKIEYRLDSLSDDAECRLVFEDGSSNELFSVFMGPDGSGKGLSIDSYSFEKWKTLSSAGIASDIGSDGLYISVFRYEGEDEIHAQLMSESGILGSVSTSEITVRTLGKLRSVRMLAEGLTLAGVDVTQPVREKSAMESLIASKSRSDGDFYLCIAQQAVQDLLDNFWEGDYETGKIIATWNGFPGNDLPDDRGGPWETSHIIYCIYDLYFLSGDAFYKDLLLREAEFYRNSISAQEWTNAGGWFNWASDDCAWNAMELIMFYDVTGDDWFLNCAIELLDNTYTRWYDDQLGGVVYKDGVDFMSLYETGMAVSWLRIWEITGEQRFYNLALASYENMYARLGAGRDDGLFFCEANRFSGIGDADAIGEAGSSSFLAGNLCMAALAAKFFRVTGDEEYLSRVYAVNEGLYTVYNNNGVFINDRDAWQNGSFSALYAAEVLSLPGTEKMRSMLYDTAYSIAVNARTYDGHYGGSWSGPASGSGSAWCVIGSVPEQAHTSAAGVEMITAAALAEAGISEYFR